MRKGRGKGLWQEEWIKDCSQGVLTVAVVIPGNFVPAQAAEEPQRISFIRIHIRWRVSGRRLHSGKELNVIYDKGDR